MKTRPKPSSLLLLASRRGRVTHFGVENSDKSRRFLCHTKLPDQHNIVVINDKVNRLGCAYCKKKYERIQLKIKALGVEWVCDGVWTPMETRTFKDSLVFKVKWG